MNILGEMYKTVGLDLLRDYLMKLDSEELFHILDGSTGVVYPWDDFDPRGIYVIINDNEETGDDEISCDFVGTMGQAGFVGTLENLRKKIYCVGQRKHTVSELEIGTVYVYRTETRAGNRVMACGVKTGKDYWEISGLGEGSNSAEIKEMLEDSSATGEFKFYFDGKEINVEGVK